MTYREIDAGWTSVAETYNVDAILARLRAVKPIDEHTTIAVIAVTNVPAQMAQWLLAEKKFDSRTTYAEGVANLSSQPR